MVRHTLRQTLRHQNNKFSFAQNKVKSIFFTNYPDDWSMMEWLLKDKKNLGLVGKEFGGRGSKWGTKDSSHPSFGGLGRFSNSTKVGSMQPSYADIVKASIRAKVGTM
ncbi:hypothetical protein Ancab_038520 [Ancistrocladus abbreviatus]